MPEADYVWLPKDDLLHFEEISALADIVHQPRRGSDAPHRRRATLATRSARRWCRCSRRSQALPISRSPATACCSSEHVDDLKAAGLRRITVSLDTLRHDRFTALARFDELTRVKEGIAAASRAFGQLKIDTVVIKNVNDDELIDLIEYGKTVNGEVRFIEYMDVGGATHWSPASVISRQEMLDRLSQHYGPIEPIVEQSSAPADRFALADGTIFGIISSTTEPFCKSCDRSRLTADGMWYLCLYATRGIDLRARASRRPIERRNRVDHRERLAAARRPRRRNAARPGRTPRVRADQSAQAGSAPRDAHEGRIGTRD